MFQRLTDFGYRRSPLQAFGFYLAYMLLISVISAVMGGVIATILELNLHTEHAKEQMRLIGKAIAIILSVAMAALILHKKSITWKGHRNGYTYLHYFHCHWRISLICARRLSHYMGKIG